jgi:hypothetical protein
MEKLSSAVLDRLYPPVGEIIIGWGMIDISIHNLAFAMFKVMGTTTKAQGWPISLGHRLDIIEKQLKKRREFQDLAVEAMTVLRHLRKHQKLRDMLSHGAAVRYDREKDAVLFRRIDRNTTKQVRREPEITHRHHEMLVRFSMLARASNNCTRITGALLGLRERIKGLKQADQSPLAKAKD